MGKVSERKKTRSDKVNAESVSEKLVKKRAGRLKTAQDVAKYMARCIRRVERGGEGSDSNTNYKLVTMASMLVRAIEAGLTEERVSKIEKVLENKEGWRR